MITARGKRCISVYLSLAFLIISGLANRLYGSDQLREKIAEIAEAEAGFDLFSGTVLVAKNGKVIYSGAFGEANKEYGVPNTLDTKFNISSIQKTFIATLIMQLYQEGIIDLDDPLTNYYPECPWELADQIKIRYLLNHTSGLADYRDNEEYQRNSEQYTCIDDVLPLIWKYEPAFTPGEKFSYSNAGVLLLKGLIEKTIGKKLEQVLEAIVRRDRHQSAVPRQS